MSDWTTTPAPGEDTIPPAPIIIKATPADAGCVVNDSRGQFAPRAVVREAMGYGWQPATDLDRELIEWERDGNRRYAEDLARGLSFEAWDGLVEDVEQWLNDNVAPADYSFGWHEGSFFLAHRGWWSQDDAPDGAPIDVHGKPIPPVCGPL